MATRDVFVDTSCLYALIDRRDGHHSQMAVKVRQLLEKGRHLVTSDYIACESVNLANARGGHEVGARILELIERSSALRLEWIGSLRFEATKFYFRKHSDQRFSFTDCTSFVLMRELKITHALTTDAHFQQAGFQLI